MQLGSPPESFAPLVQRVDVEDDHVLVYLKEVRRTLVVFGACHFVCLCAAVPPFLVLQVPKDIPMTYRLQLKRVLAVQNLKPAVINIYDYYQTSMLS